MDMEPLFEKVSFGQLPENKAKIRLAERKFLKAREDFQLAIGAKIRELSFRNPEIKKAKSDFMTAKENLENFAPSGDVQSNAPFKNSWRHRMLSELIKKAVEGGYKHISWVTGARSSEMNRLDQHFSSVLVRETKPPVQKTSDGVELPPIPDQSVDPRSIPSLQNT